VIPALFERADGGVRVAVRVTPKASRNAVQGIMMGADGRRMLKVAITAAPEGGKANAAVMEILSKAWRVPKSSIEVAAGAADRSKILFVAGEAAELLTRLSGWADDLSPNNR